MQKGEKARERGSKDYGEKDGSEIGRDNGARRSSVAGCWAQASRKKSGKICDKADDGGSWLVFPPFSASRERLDEKGCCGKQKMVSGGGGGWSLSQLRGCGHTVGVIGCTHILCAKS